MIQEQLKINPEKIDTSFSQNLMHLAVHPLQTNKEIGMPNNIICQPRRLEGDIYRNGEDVYYKVKVEQYDFAYAGDAVAKNDIVNGPVEILYKLVDGPEGSIFALQQISTNSAFLRAAFLGEKGLKEQLERAGNTQVVLNAIETKLIDELKKAPLTQPEMVTHKAYYDALTVVGHYQKGTISANQLVNELEHHESIIKKATEKSQPIKALFRKRSSVVNESSPSYALNMVIETAKKLPYAEVKDVKKNITSIHAENKAVEEKSTVSRRPSGRGS